MSEPTKEAMEIAVGHLRSTKPSRETALEIDALCAARTAELRKHADALAGAYELSRNSVYIHKKDCICLSCEALTAYRKAYPAQADGAKEMKT